MPAERSAKGAYAWRVHDLRASSDCRNGQPTAQRFGHGDEVRLDSKMLARKPFPGARKSGLHFVGDEQNSVLAANFLHDLEIIARWNNESTFAENRLGNHRGNGFRRDHALERVFKIIREGFRRGAFLRAVGICEWNAVHVAGERLEARLVRMRLAG